MSDVPVPLLSVVVPIHDEAENVPMLVEETCAVLRRAGVAFELLVVDDGSHDGSAERLHALRGGFPELRCLHMARRSGQSAALLAGLRAARGSWIATMDGDLQDDPAEIPRLRGLAGEADAVVGVRATRRDSPLRRLSSRVANAARNLVTGDRIEDIGCAMRVFRRECVSAIPPYDGMHRFVPTLFRMAGYRVVEVGVNHRPRRRGRSKYGVWNRLFRSFCDLLAVRWMSKRYARMEVRSHDR
jgi:dolichol-phosphate mannosyltransferase